MILRKCSSNFSAAVDLPASKSLSNRWLILNACADEKIKLCNLSKSADTVLLQELLNKISQANSSSDFVEIDCKNAGTVLRFLTAYLAVKPGKWLVTGDSRLSVRPVADLVDALNQLGAEIAYVRNAGELPLKIVGKPEFSRHSVRLNMQKSSQFASALMLMISKFPKGLTIDFEGEIISQPYLQMTAEILAQCGIEVALSEKKVILKGVPKPVSKVFIEADWTAASYFYALVALSESGTITFENLHEHSLQGDSRLIQWFDTFDVSTVFSDNKTLVCRRSMQTSRSKLLLNLQSYPDLAQTFAVLCVATNTPAQLYGLSSLRDKETDRLRALSQELTQIGAPNSIHQNSLILEKHGELDFSKPIKTYGDHRMAMAFSIFSALYDNVNIQQPDVVNKSFPNFWQQINKL